VERILCIGGLLGNGNLNFGLCAARKMTHPDLGASPAPCCLQSFSCTVRRLAQATRVSSAALHTHSGNLFSLRHESRRIAFLFVNFTICLVGGDHKIKLNWICPLCSLNSIIRLETETSAAYVKQKSRY